MSRVVLVIGTGRSGTSAIAGVLHKLNVHMGDQFVPADKNNRRGTYEELEFFERTRKGQDLGWLSDYISRRERGHRLWGLKDPHLSVSLREILPLFGDDIKIIVARRPRLACINSYMKAYGATQDEANEWYNFVHGKLEQFLVDDYDGEYLVVNYDDLISAPAHVVSNIADFVYDGLDDIYPIIGNAVDHIDPGISNWDDEGNWKPRNVPEVEGWGKIAIGTRIAKYPEYHFFLSWTKLLTGGTRPGDKVLMPKGWMPAHWAASELVREFLDTDLDSLLLIDDDMIFEQDDLERLRTNVKNWDYDIVSGFCTKRGWPPLPVTFKARDPQPDMPLAMNGELFDRIYDINDGDVVEVDASGLAFTLVKRRVLEEMTNEYGPSYTHYFMYDVGKESEDIYFYRRARQLGFKAAVDTVVKPLHVGQNAHGWTDFLAWKSQQNKADVVEFDAKDLIPILQEALPHLEDNKQAAQNVLGYIGGV